MVGSRKGHRRNLTSNVNNDRNLYPDPNPNANPKRARNVPETGLHRSEFIKLLRTVDTNLQITDHDFRLDNIILVCKKIQEYIIYPWKI